MAGPFDKRTYPRDAIEKTRLEFIRTDLDVLLTFATVIETESALGNREYAVRTLATIEKGYTTLVLFFSQANGLTAERQKELWSKFIQVGERLDRLQRLKVSDDENRRS